MERDFQPVFIGEEASGAFFPAFNLDDPCYSHMPFQSLLSLNQENTLLPLLEYPCATSSDPLAVTSSFFLDECSKDCTTYEKLKFIDDSKLKMPKVEPLNNEDLIVVSGEPFDFISKSSVPLCDSSFRHLPDLRSLEQVHDDFAVAESSRKRVKSLSPPAADPFALRNFQVSHYLAACAVPEFLLPATAPQSSLARQRRQRFSDKTRCLQKLLPWDKKMDMATMLEEAYKYIKFLQAQVRALQTMPSDSSSFATQNPGNAHLFGGLGKLNRQQLLQVLVNSPVAQTALYSQGCCVYSIEQLLLLKNIAERKVLYQQMIFDPTLLSSSCRH